jgi:hypothetical protein
MYQLIYTGTGKIQVRFLFFSKNGCGGEAFPVENEKILSNAWRRSVPGRRFHGETCTANLYMLKKRLFFPKKRIFREVFRIDVFAK